MGPLLRRWLAPSPQSLESCWLLVADGSWFPPTMTFSDAACVCVEQAPVQAHVPQLTPSARRSGSSDRSPVYSA